MPVSHTCLFVFLQVRLDCTVDGSSAVAVAVCGRCLLSVECKKVSSVHTHIHIQTDVDVPIMVATAVRSSVCGRSKLVKLIRYCWISQILSHIMSYRME